MISVNERDSELIIKNRSYIIASIFLIVMFYALYESGPILLAGELNTSETIGFLAQVLIPLLGTYYLIEFGKFNFNKTNDQFSWHWNNLFIKKSGQIPISNIIKVRRDALEASNLPRYQNTYRIVVITNDGQIIPLSKGFSGT